ncbi:MAG: HlyC/CorC family transporter [Acidimicrobiales bacterium]|nr:HlyC/CorC family transporter [Acidimicrobiales bacterium]
MIAILIGVVLLVANALFVAAEFASITARQTSLEAKAAAGSRAASVALESTRNLQLQLAGAQLGITMASLGLGSVLEPFVDEQLRNLAAAVPAIPEGVAHPMAFVVSLLVVVVLHTMLGETVPKNLAIAAPEATLMALAVPYRGYLWLFRPAIAVLNTAGNLGTRLVGVTPSRGLERASSPAAIAAMVEASHEEGLIEEFAHGLLAGALELANKPVSAIVTPWADVVAVQLHDSVADVEAVTVATGHSRLPLVPQGRDTVRWFLHTKDLLAVPLEERHLPVPPTYWRKLLLCRPDESIAALLRDMRRGRVHLALIVEAGGPAVGGPTPLGVVSLEDILEELVGDIRDESDAPGTDD